VDEEGAILAELGAADLAQLQDALAKVFGEGDAPLNDGPGEAQILRSLAAGLEPRFRPMVVGMVRGVMAERAGLRRIAVWGGEQPGHTADLARRRFGFSAHLATFQRPEAALEAARKPGAVAVLLLDGHASWWGRLLAERHLKVFATLPELPEHGQPSALAVAAVEVEPTGADETFFVTDAWGSPAGIAEKLGRAGFAAELVTAAGGLKLFSLAGYVQSDDARLNEAPGRLNGVIGAAPMPFDAPAEPNRREGP
jgi:hypothetical protein